MSFWSRARGVIFAWAVLAGCSDGRGSTGIDLRVVEQSPELRPAAVELLWFEGDVLRLQRRVPAAGDLDPQKPLDVRILVEVPITAEAMRGIYVRGLRDGATVSEGVAVVTVVPGEWRELSLVLGPPTIPDLNRDGIPDELQTCTRPGGCGPRDAGAGMLDAAASPDAEEDAAVPDAPDAGAADAPVPDVAAVIDSAPDLPAPDASSPDTVDAEGFPVMSKGIGLRAEYFDNVDFTRPLVTGTDPRISFEWAGGSPHPSLGPDQFSVRWRGALEPRFTESYTFHVQNDDTFRLILDNTTIINYTGPSRGDRNTVVRLIAGRRYELTIEFTEKTGNAWVQWAWSSPSQPKEIVPASQLYPP